MAIHNDIGKNGESLAAAFLESKGYTIVCKNWRHSHYEIDIIAIKNELLRIIEVKSLKSSELRHPEESVTKKKFNHLVRAADEFLFQNQQYRHVQFDILSIVVGVEKEPEYFLIEDVFI